MNSEIEKLISLAVATGEITEKSKATILRKAQSLGENLDEVTMIIDGENAILKSNKNSNQIHSSDNPIETETETEKISFIYAFKMFINNYPIVKYSLIFFLVCLGFFLFSVLVTLCI